MFHLHMLTPRGTRCGLKRRRSYGGRQSRAAQGRRLELVPDYKELPDHAVHQLSHPDSDRLVGKGHLQGRVSRQTAAFFQSACVLSAARRFGQQQTRQKGAPVCARGVSECVEDSEVRMDISPMWAGLRRWRHAVRLSGNNGIWSYLSTQNIGVISAGERERPSGVGEGRNNKKRCQGNGGAGAGAGSGRGVRQGIPNQVPRDPKGPPGTGTGWVPQHKKND